MAGSCLATIGGDGRGGSHLRAAAAEIALQGRRGKGGNTYIHTYIHTYIYAYIHTHIHNTYIHTYIIHTYVDTYIPTYIHTYIQTYRQTNGQTDRQTDRQTEFGQGAGEYTNNYAPYPLNIVNPRNTQNLTNMLIHAYTRPIYLWEAEYHSV